MTNSKWLFGYGAFLFLCGLAGYISNPEKAISALYAGSVSGVLSAIWGILLMKGMGFARWAAIATASLLSIVFVIRASISWQKVMDGDPKAFAASLITLMLVGSLATVARLFLKKA